jgi:hypothetical protein
MPTTTPKQSHFLKKREFAFFSKRVHFSPRELPFTPTPAKPMSLTAWEMDNLSG